MALTFRTGSDGKGSALTIEELDNNFRFFTGSHEISGSLIVSSSLIGSGSMGISGSIIPTEAAATLGSVTNPFKDLFVSPDSIVFTDGTSALATLNQNNIGNVSGSGVVHSAQTQLGQDSIQNEVTFWYTSSGGPTETTHVSGSRAFTVIPSGSAFAAASQGVEVRITGSLRITGSNSLVGNGVNANAFEVKGNSSEFSGKNLTAGHTMRLSGSLQVTSSLEEPSRFKHGSLGIGTNKTAVEITGSLNITASAGQVLFMSGLPTSDPGVVGQVYNDGGTLKISI